MKSDRQYMEVGKFERYLMVSGFFLNIALAGVMFLWTIRLVGNVLSFGL